MDGLAFERHRFTKGRAGLGRQLFLETGLEGEVAGADNELAHSLDLVTGQVCGKTAVRFNLAYWSGRFASYEKPKIPLLWISGSGGGVGAASACGGGATGAGKVSHFIE